MQRILITHYLVWAEIDRLSKCPSNPEPASTATIVRKDKADVRRMGLTGSERRKASRHIGIFHSPESAKNERIRLGLERIYGLEKTKTVLEQANSIYHVNNPLSPTNPEIYELFETGVIDEALEFFGQSWVIGRPRIE